MAHGGHTRLPDGSVIVALCLPRPAVSGGPTSTGDTSAEPRIRLLVHARNRARALTRVRNLGLPPVYLRGNIAPPTPDEITAVLHHPDGMVWRAALGDDTESWRPMSLLLRPEPAA